MTGKAGTSRTLTLYQTMAAPRYALWRALLALRARSGKEERARIGERTGRASLPRPEGALLWAHGASVGETLSLLPLLDALHRRHAELHQLCTSGTRAAASLMRQRLPAHALHQYAPVDCKWAVTRYLNHWRPSIALFAESELWPSILCQTADAGVRLALVNARISERSATRWARFAPAMAAALLDKFHIILAQTDADEARLRALGAPEERMQVTGNLKAAAQALPVNGDALASMREALGTRPLWLAASTHRGEERTVLAAHASLLRRHPDALLILAPRHPQRGEEIARLIAREGFAFAMRSKAQPIGPSVSVYLADSLGELGLWYRLAPIAFMGGSLKGGGGHNPLEAARFSVALICGPHCFNFAREYRQLDALGACVMLPDAASLPACLPGLFSETGAPGGKAQAMRRASGAHMSQGDAILRRVSEALAPLLVSLP